MQYKLSQLLIVLGLIILPFNIAFGLAKEHYEILVLVGSLRENSLNHKAAIKLQEKINPKFNLSILRLHDLPDYNQDDDHSQSLVVKDLKYKIEHADGIIFVSPEYNVSVPGALKNAIDHASRPYKSNSWQQKPISILGFSLGRKVRTVEHQHLRAILTCLDANIMPPTNNIILEQDIFFTDNGAIGKQGHDYLQEWLHTYEAWMES